MPCLLALTLALCTMPSCHRATIYEQANNVEIIFNYDLSEDDTTMFVKPQMPTLMKVLFYDAETHACVAENYFRSEGGKVYGILPGRYDVVTYSYNSEITEVTGEQNIRTIKAFTSKLAMDTDSLGTVIRQPDHLLAGLNYSVEIPYLTKEDPAFVIETDIATILDSYTIQIDSLKGLENITSVSIYLTGHSSYNMLGYNKRAQESSTLAIPCSVDLENYRLFSTFTTFGKTPVIPGRAVIHVVVTGPGGTVYDFDEDITEQYYSEDHHIRLCIHGYIKPRPQNEFDPEVDEWKADEEFIEIL